MRPAIKRPTEPAVAQLFDLVLHAGHHGPGRGGWQVHAAAWLLALGVHGLLLLLASGTEPSLERWSARMAAQVHSDLAANAPLLIETLPAPPQAPPAQAQAEPAPPSAARPRARPSTAAARTSKAAAQTPAPPAAAGRVLTAQDTGPVDLTDQSFIAGTASAYVGGASRAGGRGHVPAHAAASPAGTPAGVGRGRRTQPGPAETRQGQSKARPVQLAQSEWQCDWPQVAVDQAIYEQSVVLRVVVRPDGSVAQASVAQDPGHGFGRAAIACARRTRFTPARDPQGHAIQATSPPIRVRFTR